jgi:hypothetical protein
MHRSLVLVVSVLLVGMLLSACGGRAPVFAPVAVPPGKGVVYVYRPRNPMGGAVSYVVEANGTPLLRLRDGGYYPFFADPGTVIFSAKTEVMSQAALDVVAGGTHYVKGTVTMGAFVGRPNLQVVHPAIAPNEIAGCRLQSR